MSILKQKTTELISKYATSKGDTGSVQVQAAIMTERINNLTKHFNDNHKDYQSRRGLIALVNKRKKLLRYLKKRNLEQYQLLIKSLGLRK